jgi:signal transduction histidine kinase
MRPRRNLRLGLRLRLIAFVALPVVASGTLALVLTTRSVTAYERAQTEATLRAQAPGVARLFAKSAQRFFVTTGRPVQFSDDVTQVTAASIFYVTNPSAAFPYPGGNVREWNALRLDWKAINRGATQSVVAVPPGTHAQNVIVASGVFFTRNNRPTADGAQDAIGAIVLARPLSGLAPPQRFWAGRLAPAFEVGLAVAAAFGLILGFRLAAPVRRLVTAAGAVAAGRFEVSLDRRRRDEFGELNRAFADMADQLQEAREHERLFLMRVSHELRTPLTSIQGHVGALVDEIVDDPTTSYSIIASEAARLERLIRDILDLAKLEGRRFALLVDDVDLDVLVDRALAARLGLARAKGVELRLDGDALGELTGDGDRVLQILSNLLDNAIRWSPPGGIVRVTGSSSPSAVRLAVADSGPGVPIERRGDVLRPFYSEDAKGTGLGLAIASELALAMGGRLTVGEAPGGGALFGCELPRVPVQRPAPVVTSP